MQSFSQRAGIVGETGLVDWRQQPRPTVLSAWPPYGQYQAVRSTAQGFWVMRNPPVLSLSNPAETLGFMP